MPMVMRGIPLTVPSLVNPIDLLHIYMFMALRGLTHLMMFLSRCSHCCHLRIQRSPRPHRRPTLRCVWCNHVWACSLRHSLHSHDWRAERMKKIKLVYQLMRVYKTSVFILKSFVWEINPIHTQSRGVLYGILSVLFESSIIWKSFFPPP